MHKKFAIVSFITGTVVFLFCSIGSPTVFAAKYSITELTNINTRIFHPYCINNRSEIAGDSLVGPTTNNYDSFGPFASVYSNGTIRVLGSLGVGYNGAASINDSGQMTGYFSLTNFFLQTIVHAFISTPSGLQDLGTIGGSNSVGSSINQAGDVVGYSETSNSVNHAFLYSGGTMTDLGTLGGSNSYAYGINNLGQIVGRSDTTNGETHAFLYASGHMTDIGILGGTNGSASAINDSGQIVGSSSTVDGTAHAFLYFGNTMLDLGTAGSLISGLSAINGAGQAVGVSSPENGDYLPAHATIYCAGFLQDLNDLIDPTAGWFLGLAFGINDRGQIVGFGSHDWGAGGGGFLLTPLPRLEIVSHEPNKVLLSWTTNFAEGFQLEMQSNLGDTNWEAVAGSPILSGDHFYSTNSTAGQTHFFRLHRD